MKNLNFKIVTTVISVLVFTLGIVLYVNAKEKNLPFTDKTEDPEIKTWHFNGTDNDQATDAEQYVEHTNQPCGGTQTICQVLAPEDDMNPGYPDLSYDILPGQSVEDRIEAALSGTNPSTNETVLSLRSF